MAALFLLCFHSCGLIDVLSCSYMSLPLCACLLDPFLFSFALFTMMLLPSSWEFFRWVRRVIHMFHPLTHRCLHCISRSSPFDTISHPGASQRLIGNCHPQLSALFSEVLAHVHQLVSPAWNDQALHTDLSTTS